MPRTKKEKVVKEEKKESVKLSLADYEKKVLVLAKEGLTSEKIGEKLRKEGVHPKDYEKKISKILKDNNAYAIADLKNIEKKLGGIIKHYEKNKGDRRAMREKDRIFAQLRKIKTYFKIPLK